jgi:SOS-response transcriptional repressor LexA
MDEVKKVEKIKGKEGERKGGRGGRRAGAGRPAGDSRLYTFRAPGEMAEVIDRQESKTDFIRGCITRAMRSDAAGKVGWRSGAIETVGEVRGQSGAVETIGEVRGRSGAVETVGEVRGQSGAIETVGEVRGQSGAIETVGEVRGQSGAVETIGEVRGQSGAVETIGEVRGRSGVAANADVEGAAAVQDEAFSGLAANPARGSGRIIPATAVRGGMRLPFFDLGIRAGFPIPLDNDEKAQDIELLRMLCPHPEASYLIRVAGNSMIDAGINDGDIIIVDKSHRNPSPSEVAVCELNGEYTLKRFEKDGEGCGWLVPANPDYPRIRITEDDSFSVWGTVSYIIHKPRL